MIDAIDLREVIESDPVCAGALAAGEHNVIAAYLNEPTEQTIDRARIPSAEVDAVIDDDEYAALPTDVKALVWQALESGYSLTPKMIDRLARLFPEKGATASALTALKSRPATRAEVLFEREGVAVSDLNIGEAFKQPDQVGEVEGDVLVVKRGDVEIARESLETARPEVAQAKARAFAAIDAQVNS